MAPFQRSSAIFLTSLAAMVGMQLHGASRVVFETELRGCTFHHAPHRESPTISFSSTPTIASQEESPTIASKVSTNLIWGIHCGREDREMRSAIRETYLNQTNVCSLQDALLSGDLKDCQVYYTFLISPNVRQIDITSSPILKSTPKSMSLERDVTVLAYGPFLRGVAWLKYASSLPLDAGHIVHTNADVVVWPELIGNMIRRKEEQPYRFSGEYPENGTTASRQNGDDEILEYGSVQIPFQQGLEPGPCTKAMSNSLPTSCHDASGRMLLFSVDLAKKMTNMNSISDEAYNFDADELLTFLARNFTIQRRYALGLLGAYPTAKGVRDEWSRQEENRNKWNQIDRRVIAVTGKFGHGPGSFRQEVAHRRNVLVAGGLRPDQIMARDSFTPEVLDDPRWAKHLNFVRDPKDGNPRGGGYWFWKPVLLLEALEQLKNGDFVLYGDTDLSDDWSWKPYVLRLMIHRGHDVAAYLGGYPENVYNKRDVYKRYCGDRNQETDESMQYWAGQIILQKSPGVMEFVRAWAKDSSDYHIISDSPSIEPNIPGFKEHRHDQSIMSLLLQCRYHNHKRTPIEHPKAPSSNVFPYTMKLVPTKFQTK